MQISGWVVQMYANYVINIDMGKFLKMGFLTPWGAIEIILQPASREFCNYKNSKIM